MSEEKLVPKLRFNGFDDEWTLSKLKEICMVQDGTHSTPNYTEQGIPFYSVENITNNVPPKFISKEEHEKLIKRCKPQLGDILVTRIGTLAESKVIDWDEEFSIYVSLALLSDIKINSNYLNTYIQSPFYRSDFLSKSLLIAVPPKINLSDLETTVVKYPTRSEQEEIAKFFSIIDAKIKLLEDKLQAYNDFKKYLMQQIFTQKLRFEDDEDWKIVKLGDICKIKTGKLDANAMVENGKYRFYTCAEEYYFIDDYAYDTEALLISGNGAHVGYIHYYNGKFNAYQRTYILDQFTENIKLIMYILDKNLKKRIQQEKNEGSTPYIKLSTLKDMKIDIPQSKTEQEKITSIFTNINNKIDYINVELENMQNFKKGLLQQMFDNMIINI